VIYGENPQNEYGAGPAEAAKQTKLTKAWVDDFGGLLGLRLDDMADILEIPQRELEIYRYPREYVQALFLGAYFPWDGFENFEIAKRHGFETYPTDVEGSLFGYENLDNAQTGIHDYLRFLKFGYGRATDIASTHIRRHRMTRADAIEMVHDRDGAFPKTYLGVRLEDILRRISMSVAEFHSVCERFTNAQVVEWALRRESYQSYFGPSTDASRGDSSTRAVA
jgi:hypothetical protein